VTRAGVLDLPTLSHESPLRLLLIEDSVSDSDLVLALLEDELPHAALSVAESLQQALILLGDNHYDAVLADLSLPDADGVAVVLAVRAEHPDTALLVLTGRADGGLAMWALAAGAQDYLVKGQHDGARIATALLHALQRQRAEREMPRYPQLIRGLLNALEAPTCVVGADSRIVAVNQAWRDFATASGAEPEDCAEGSSYLLVCERLAVESRGGFGAFEVVAGLHDVLAGTGELFRYEYGWFRPGGDRWFNLRIAAAEVDGARGGLISHVDVTTTHVAQTVLAHQSLHDAVTGLPNRLLLIDRLDQALAGGDRRAAEVAVAFVDLDHFKRVNDSLGHRAGDELLAKVAERLSADLRGRDTVSRFSGDEFVIIWRDVADDEEIRALSSRLQDAFLAPFEVAGTSITVSASVGVAVSRGSQSGESLVQAADAAMYDAKRHGRGRVRMFSHELLRGVEERMSIEIGLRAALDNEELVLHYQPVIDLVTGRPVAVEALVRWQHPVQGLLAPEQFIPVAEASGLIEPLGAWVLTQACRDAAAFGKPDEQLTMAVNISVRQLTQPDLLAQVGEALAVSGLTPQRLMLEVTESAVMEDEEAAESALRSLADLGVRIAIDDFGTGYSSLLYLRRYPISALKLDRAFVAGIGISAEDEAICSSVVSLAHAVGVTSIGEGVETAQQCAALRAYGCQQAQGFYWSAAVPLPALAGVLATCREAPAAANARRKPRIDDKLEPAVAARIMTLHRAGASVHTIAAAMNRDAAPNPLGGRWTANAIAWYVSS
jgi:diguanylate cyclase (GGDEF)-like protein